ncbi:hypothetical protein OG568_50605 (plasmid) [Streptomyces sp. NBC_01450]|uniref:hypothetical protein n=1 Tax=Streptomyces sp. NBC_01450 TaxID=2903871 RepID=UPI002E334679|nr:hypothetical protein [Streptomyces sp. NBC_01450]
MRVRISRRAHAVMIAAALAGNIVVPLAGAQPTAAADCLTSVPTYVWEPNATRNIAAPRVLHKYMDWGPQSGTTDTLIDTLYTANLPTPSKIFTGGGNGIIYEATSGGQVKSYKDNTATGGALLTPVKTYSLAWQNAKRIWTNGSRVFVLNAADSLEVYEQSAPTTGNGTLTKISETATSTAALFDATNVWMVNSTVYALTSTGTINQYSYTETPIIGTVAARLQSAGVVATGLTDVSQAWSPGSGVVDTQTTTSDPDTTSQIAKYSTGPWTQLDPEVRTGIVGTIMADAGPCLADPAPSVQPYFATPPDETGGAEAVDAPEEAAQTPSNTVTGKFTLGNGQPAAGLPVTLTANDLGDDATGETQVPFLGMATTAADGTWSITLPGTLPADVQQADDNGGILNLQATAEGVTTTTKHPGARCGHPLHRPVQQSATVSGQSDDGHSTLLAPNTLSGTTQDTYAGSTDSSTLAAKIEADPAPAPDTVPMWQSDNSTLAADYNPYLVNGHDVSAEAVRPPIVPMGSGNCWDTKTKIDSSTKYTVVGEAHANWDAKSTFEYESSMSSSIDTAVKSSGNWTTGASKELSQSNDMTVGWSNKSKYSHQYQVPILYKKWKYQHWCSGSVRATWYKIEASGYHIPADGAAGKFGKDVSSKDGSANFNKAPKANRTYLEGGGGTLSLAHGSSVKFGGAVSAFGISLGAKTGYDSNHRQRITFGNQPGKHRIWGKNGSLSSGHAGVFYSK